MPPEEIGKAYKLLKEDGFLMLSYKPEIIDLDIEYMEEEIEEVVDDIVEEPKQLPKREKRKYTKKNKINSHIPRKMTKYTKEILDRMREVINRKSNKEIQEMLRLEFGHNVSEISIAVRLSREGIKRDKKTKPKGEEEIEAKMKELAEPVETIEVITPEMIRLKEREKTKRKGMSEEVVELIQDKYMEMTDEELRGAIADKHGAFFQVDKIKAYRESNGMARPEGWNPDDFKDSEEDL